MNPEPTALAPAGRAALSELKSEVSAAHAAPRHGG
jgi:hypothetical protein